MNALESLNDIVNPPRVKSHSHDPGSSFPPDYRKLIQEYGTGRFDNFLAIMNSPHENQFLDIGYQTESQLSALRSLEEFEDIPYPINGNSYPTLKCWGITDNGDACYWVAPSEATEDWYVAINAARDEDWSEYKGTVTSFLVDVLTGRFVSTVFPDSFPSSSPSFLPDAGSS